MQVDSPKVLYNKVLMRIEDDIAIKEVDKNYDSSIPFTINELFRNFSDLDLYLFLLEQYKKHYRAYSKNTITPYEAKKRVLAIRIIIFSL